MWDHNGATPGAAKALGLVLPDLKGKLDGYSMRVPTPNVSLVDLVAFVEKTSTTEEVHAAFKKAGAGPLKGILDFTEEELVSVDFRGNPHSAIVDAGFTKVIDGTCIKVTAWYDNTHANPNNPDPDQWVGFGDRTVDEMGHAWMNVTYLSDEEYAAWVAEQKTKLQASR